MSYITLELKCAEGHVTCIDVGEQKRLLSRMKCCVCLKPPLTYRLLRRKYPEEIMTNYERLKALLEYKIDSGEEFPFEHEMLIGTQALRKLASGETLLINRARVESILEDLKSYEELQIEAQRLREMIQP